MDWTTEKAFPVKFIGKGLKSHGSEVAVDRDKIANASAH